VWHARAAQGFPISVTFETPKKGTMLKCSTGRRMARTRQPAPIATPRMDLSRLQYFPLALPHFSLLAGIFLVHFHYRIPIGYGAARCCASGSADRCGC
jgi:hypothetical protein